ncbi:MAG: hypothetical protein ACP6IY_22015 [Promethearchaeia archaeon]
MSIEILSTITISNILHNHDGFKIIGKNNDFFKKLEELVYKFTKDNITSDEVECWEELKKDFPNHMKEKIKKFLPINKKVVKLAELNVQIEDLKVNINNYKSIELSKLQSNLTIKNIIGKFYKYRNKLFHSGTLPNQWDLKFDRLKSYFIKLLEQLFFKILEMDNITYYHIGYPK